MTTRVVPADLEADRERVLDLWRSGLSHHGKHEEKYRWHYSGRLGGPSQVMLLEEAGQAIGAAGLSPRRLRAGGEWIEAGLLSDFVLDPEHRVLFPALQLQRGTREQGLRRYAVLYGRPNEASEAVVKRVGYRQLGERVRYAAVVRSASYLARYVPRSIAAIPGAAIDAVRRGLRAMAIARSGFVLRALPGGPDERFDALWESASREPGRVIGVRDRAFLDWRFAQCPLHAYRFYALESAGGRLAGYAVAETHGAVLSVGDFLVDPAEAGAPRALWRGLLAAADRLGLRSVEVILMAGPATIAAAHAAGLRPRDRRPIYATTASAQALLSKEWYLTLADLDDG